MCGQLMIGTPSWAERVPNVPGLVSREQRSGQAWASPLSSPHPPLSKRNFASCARHEGRESSDLSASGRSQSRCLQRRVLPAETRADGDNLSSSSDNLSLSCVRPCGLQVNGAIHHERRLHHLLLLEELNSWEVQVSAGRGVSPTPGLACMCERSRCCWRWRLMPPAPTERQRVWVVDWCMAVRDFGRAPLASDRRLCLSPQTSRACSRLISNRLRHCWGLQRNSNPRHVVVPWSAIPSAMLTHQSRLSLTVHCSGQAHSRDHGRMF